MFAFLCTYLPKVTAATKLWMLALLAVVGASVVLVGWLGSKVGVEIRPPW